MKVSYGKSLGSVANSPSRTPMVPCRRRRWLDAVLAKHATAVGFGAIEMSAELGSDSYLYGQMSEVRLGSLHSCHAAGGWAASTDAPSDLEARHLRRLFR